MTKVNHIKFATLFAITVLLTTSLALQSAPSASAVRICGDRICDSQNGPDAEAEREQLRQQVKSGTAVEEEPEAPVEEEPEEEMVAPEAAPEMEEKMEEKMEKKADHGWKTTTGTITSMVDPGVGHETHQLAIILPPTDKVYKGILSYSASEPIQLVALHGPLAEGEDAGQAIWTPDGTTKFALTFIDPETSMGSWMFTGNALAVHTLNTDQFTVSYSVSYMEKEMSDTVKTGTITSMVDPGVGHETHQLAIILPPSDKAYSGLLTYSASEPIQLVALHGPLAEGEDAGQAIWTPDGTTKFALTFIDPETAMGSWMFTGNALAVHTLNTDQFTVSYSVSYMEKEMSDTVKTGTITSMVDPGVGHETHQLAIILPPSDKAYSGLLTYSASEPIQLVALHGPLAEGEDAGQAIWTPDGTTKFALTFVDKKAAAGTWKFAGNALAVHTLNTEPFTVSYSVVAGQ